MAFVYFIIMGVLGIILLAAIGFFLVGLFRGGNSDTQGFLGGSLITIAAVVILGFVFSAFMFFGSVDRGHIGVMTTFGRVNLAEVKEEGFYAKNPIAKVSKMSIQRRSIQRTSSVEEEGKGNEVIAIASNDVRLTMDVSFPYRLNPDYAALVFRHIGDDKRYENELIFKASAKAVRDGVSGFTDSEAYQSKRAEVSVSVTDFFSQAIVDQLRDLEGFKDLSEEQLSNVIQVFPVQITRIEPPAKILNAIEEKVAAQQDLDRQETLTLIAEEIAQRRRNEGTGLFNLLEELPEDVTVRDAIDLLHASADMQRAQALTKAVEEGEVEVVYMSGGVNTIAASAPGQGRQE